MRTKCPIGIKQTALEREFNKLLIICQNKIKILTSNQFHLVLPEHFINVQMLKYIASYRLPGS